MLPEETVVAWLSHGEDTIITQMGHEWNSWHPVHNGDT